MAIDWTLGAIISGIGAIMTYLWRRIDELTKQTNNHLNSISEKLGRIETNIEWLKERLR